MTPNWFDRGAYIIPVVANAATILVIIHASASAVIRQIRRHG
jgi:hypothetical protein